MSQHPHVLPDGSLLLVLHARLPRWLGKDFPVGKEHDMLSAEFLLQLSDKSGLDLLESPQLWDWHVDDDGL
jgi:hypothetical protein